MHTCNCLFGICNWMSNAHLWHKISKTKLLISPSPNLAPPVFPSPSIPSPLLRHCLRFLFSLSHHTSYPSENLAGSTYQTPPTLTTFYHLYHYHPSLSLDDSASLLTCLPSLVLPLIVCALQGSPSDFFNISLIPIASLHTSSSPWLTDSL